MTRAVSFAVATTVLAIVGIYGSEALLILRPLQCPYISGKIVCVRAQPILCNDTSCPGDGYQTCCKDICSGTKCIALPNMCPGSFDFEDSTPTTCSEEDTMENCTSSAMCQGGSCCANQCGGTQCLALNKSGTCPPRPPPSQHQICPFAADATETHCENDTNCAGSTKCCLSENSCFGLQCTSVDKPGACRTIDRRLIKCAAPTNESAADDCNGDYSCPDSQKCCEQPCTGKRCDVAIKPGSCPELVFGCPPQKPLIKDMCTDDYNCTDNNKCCPNACTGQTCKQAEKPGTCPPPLPPPSKNSCKPKTSSSTGTVAPQCKGDYDCEDNQKCCTRSGTYKKCMDMPAVKLGHCPAVSKCPSPQAGLIRKDLCTEDYNCTGNQKCCPNPCTGRTCKPAEKAGKCPAGQQISGKVSMDQCQGDFDCSEPRKCCVGKNTRRQCIQIPELKKPSPVCPLWDKRIICIRQNDQECSEVNPCPNKCAKCCPYECGGTRCVDQVNLCPAVGPVIPCFVAGKRHCEGSGGCNGSYCCDDVTCGGLTCTSKPGNCPPNYLKCAMPSEDRWGCHVDSDCPNPTQKCCNKDCQGMQCVDPVGVCPSIKPGEVGVCVTECSDSNPCTGGKACCKTACGGSVCA